MDKVFLWLYRIFSYFVPGGIALYFCVIDELMKKDVSVMAKIGLSGVFVHACMVLIAIYFLGKHYRKTLTKLTDQILECMDDDKKRELIQKKHEIEAKQDIFHNLIFIAPFLICYFVVCLIENQMVSLRGPLFAICCSMAAGLGFNGIEQYLKTHKK